jgi:hypothetical protein
MSKEEITPIVETGSGGIFLGGIRVSSTEEVKANIENLANQVRNLANKLEEHMHKPDAHNPGILRKK